MKKTSISSLSSFLVLALILVLSVECESLAISKARDEYSPEQLKALTRDDNGRIDPDELSLGIGRGSFAAWPVLLFVMAG
jgi:hypothetical protein